MSILQNVLAFYLIFGITHWAAHQATCDKCRSFLRIILFYVVESIFQIGSWPYQVYLQLKANSVPDDVSFIEIKQEKGEAFDDFENRVRSQYGNLVADSLKISKEKKDETKV